MIHRSLLFAVVFCTIGLVSPSRAEATTINMATLAPRHSAWGKVFHAWSKALARKSHGKLVLRWYWNGQQGDAASVVRKMRSGQLDGGAVTAVGLAQVYKPILAFSMPGLFRDWPSLDRTRSAMLPKFQATFRKLGFELLGSGDVGKARTMSKGKAIRTPADLKTRKVYVWRDDPVAPKLAKLIGFTPVLESIPGLLPALSAGRVDTITVPALAATQLQWWQHLDHVNASVAGIAIGGMLMSRKGFAKIPADTRGLFAKTGKKASSILRRRIRKLDSKSYRLIRKRMTVVNLTRAEKGRWAALFARVRRKLAEDTFPKQIVHEMERHAGVR